MNYLKNLRPLTIYLLFLFFLSCDTKDEFIDKYNKSFLKYFGKQGNDEGVAFVINPVEGFFLLGNHINDTFQSYFFLVSINNQGNTIWEQSFFEQENIYAKDIVIDKEGNLIVVGNITDNTDGTTDIGVFKFSQDAAFLKRTIIGSKGVNEVVNKAFITNNNDLLLIGDSIINNNNRHIISYRMSTDLEFVRWNPNFGYSDKDDSGQFVEEDANGNLYFYYSSNRPVPKNSTKAGYNFLIYQTNNIGTLKSNSQKIYGNDKNQFLNNVHIKENREKLLVGYTKNFLSNTLFVARVGINYNVIFEKEISQSKNVIGKDIIGTEGGMLVLGDEFDGTNNDIILIKIDNNGEIVWSKNFGGDDNDTSLQIEQLSDNSIVIMATVELESQTKMTFMKVDKNGEL